MKTKELSLEIVDDTQFVEAMLDAARYSDFSLSMAQREKMLAILGRDPNVLNRKVPTVQYHGTKRSPDLDTYDRNPQ